MLLLQLSERHGSVVPTYGLPLRPADAAGPAATATAPLLA